MIEPHMYFTEFAPRNKRRCAVGDLVYPKATTGKAKQSCSSPVYVTGK